MMFTAYKIFKSQAKEHDLSNVSKYFFRWKRSLKPGSSSVKDEQPWIIFKAIDFLDGYLNSSHRVFEYGGGGSTLFFTKRAAEVVTVEHNKEWFGILTETLSKKNVKNWKGVFAEAAKGDLVSLPDYANPGHYSSDDEPSKGYNYKEYVTVIDKYMDGYFDCVVIDGRSRPACVLHAIPKIKRGGLLVLDNSDRKYYLEQTRGLLEKDFDKIISDFGPSPYSKDFTHTSIWQKK